MLLVIDVGNTNITLGIFSKEGLIGNFRLTTKMPRTSDEYGIDICNLLEHRNFTIGDIEDVIIASVVPDIMYSLNSSIIKYFHIEPIIVGPGIKTGIRLAMDNPKEVGADRIVDAVGAYELYGGPVIIVDFGTATTYDLVTQEGAFTAGVTAPGISTSAKALWQDAAKLPKIEIKKPASILSKETISSMQAGIVYGYIGQTEYIISKMKEESKLEGIKVVATGGLGIIIAQETSLIDIYDPTLTLKGLQCIYNRCKKS
ncbi:type III pantothenate kinase [Lachnotalea glycerini]|uniref:Type III pantothenate kinase n=1 Tax=Lachnotalea glycerini TaxID=1763509 RepID=A0A255IEH3_9FIRM|nr:type III pantothenate kinase [Lachnotalea glycerini]PXV90241.1 type III pantothenate kinase [Lachnotalea glycerini]RDY30633.1 type III pantothenate kinase [Lachnotalea glycerini]